MLNNIPGVRSGQLLLLVRNRAKSALILLNLFPPIENISVAVQRVLEIFIFKFENAALAYLHHFQLLSFDRLEKLNILNKHLLSCLDAVFVLNVAFFLLRHLH
jgi:hypothetical protein